MPLFSKEWLSRHRLAHFLLLLYVDERPNPGIYEIWHIFLLFVLKYKKFRVVISYYSNNSCWWFDLIKISWILKTHYRICYEILNDERTHTSSICMNVRVCILNYIRYFLMKFEEFNLVLFVLWLVFWQEEK